MQVATHPRGDGSPPMAGIVEIGAGNLRFRPKSRDQGRSDPTTTPRDDACGVAPHRDQTSRPTGTRLRKSPTPPCGGVGLVPNREHAPCGGTRREESSGHCSHWMPWRFRTAGHPGSAPRGLPTQAVSAGTSRSSMREFPQTGMKAVANGCPAGRAGHGARVTRRDARRPASPAGSPDRRCPPSSPPDTRRRRRRTHPPDDDSPTGRARRTAACCSRPRFPCSS